MPLEGCTLRMVCVCVLPLCIKGLNGISVMWRTIVQARFKPMTMTPPTTVYAELKNLKERMVVIETRL